MPNTDLDVAVIGAGPHGLSAAVHLRRAGIQAQVFGEPMSFWRTMPRGMKLRSNMSATNIVEPVGPLSLRRFMDETGVQFGYPVPLERFIEYGEWVQREGVPDIDGRRVTNLARTSNGFALSLGEGEAVTARRAVVACGIAPFEHTPPEFSALPAHRTSHTGRHADLSVFRGQRVAVVGAGQSAFECAALLHEGGADHVEVLARRSDVVWLRGKSIPSRLGPAAPVFYAPTDVGPLWYSRLVAMPDLFRRLPRRTQARIAYRCIRPACSHFVRVRLDEVDVSLGVSLTGGEDTGAGVRLTLSDGSSREVDHVMFGTGYRVDFARHAFLDRSLLADLRLAGGYPMLRRGLESSVAGLHVLGAPAAWSFGPTMRFVSGSWYGGSELARGVSAARRRSRAGGMGGPVLAGARS